MVRAGSAGTDPVQLVADPPRHQVAHDDTASHVSGVLPSSCLAGLGSPTIAEAALAGRAVAEMGAHDGAGRRYWENGAVGPAPLDDLPRTTPRPGASLAGWSRGRERQAGAHFEMANLGGSLSSAAT